jgi:uncharacterized membrane protein
MMNINRYTHGPKWTCALAVLLGCLMVGLGQPGVRAQGDPAASSPPAVAEGIVTSILEAETIELQGESQQYQKLEIRVLTGPRNGETVVVETGDFAAVAVSSYAVGDRVLLESSPDGTGAESFFITDRVRRAPLYLLFGLFVVVTVLVGRGRGFASLIGLAFSFAVIFLYVLPQILAGRDPILVALSAALVIIPVTFSLSHGLNRKTGAAVVGTVVALAITALLATAFVDLTQLTGYSSEEAAFLQIAQQGALNMRGLLLASIIIGLLGILDDITVSQAAIVYQLHDTSPGLTRWELYRRAMDVGRDHIASLVNTLILVYTSAALPLLLLFQRDTTAFGTVINYEIVAEEIVRTLLASIGLILAVPITTAVTCVFIAYEADDSSPLDLGTLDP